jgi:multidrug transporter EmrE-like cation transporter
MSRWWLLSMAVGMEIVGDFFLKRWASSRALHDAILGFSIFGIGTIGWALMLRYDTLQRAIILFTAANLVAGIGVGYFCFHERMGTRGYAAALLCIIAIILCETEA